MLYQDFFDQVMSRAGFDRRADGERAIAAVLETLGACLGAREREALAGELAEALRAPLTRHEPAGGFDRAELFSRVALRENVALGFAIEHTEVVCELIAEALPDGALDVLRAEVGAELAALFVRRASPRLPHPPPHRHPLAVDAPDMSLSGGRPASFQPLSEARPEDGQTHSVARESNPHADSKLSSSPGLTQERLGESLAAGRVGSKHPIGGR